jgi:hypothetical protein
MDDVGSASGDASEQHEPQRESILSLSHKIRKKLCCEGELAVKAHMTASINMRDLHALVASSDDRVGAQEGCMMLLFAGISVYRRVVVHPQQDGEEATDYKVSVALLFILQLLLTPRQPGVAFEELAPAAHEVDAPTVTSSPCEALLKRANLVELQSYSSETGHENDGPDAICRACIALGHFWIAQGEAVFTFDKSKAPSRVTLDDVSTLSYQFFRASALTLQTQMLHGEIQRPKRKRDDFLTLDAASLINDAGADNERLEAIAALGESEVGQQIFKDLILSFMLPSGVLGVRRTPLLARETSEVATSKFAESVNSAHEAAMRGTEWTYPEDPIVLHKTAALLAGVAVLFAGKSSTDEIKRADAFNGRLVIPFFEVPLCKTGETLIAYTPMTDDWVAFKLKNGQPSILLRQKGFQGLGSVVLLATKK